MLETLSGAIVCRSVGLVVYWANLGPRSVARSIYRLTNRGWLIEWLN